jgi:hypothetical protein
MVGRREERGGKERRGQLPARRFYIIPFLP